MKTRITIFLLTIMVFQTFSPIVTKAAYFLNKGYIARVLCINKEKPAMHCNGRCYLSRKLKEQEKQDQESPAPKKETFQVQPFFLPDQVIVNPDLHLRAKKYYIPPVYFRSSFLHSVFHPPTSEQV